ncbi:hypothetical protein [Paenibacillus nasutitermitis]|uniref:Uncharacterized protein n=1 Tax=Paenibacillus nasutitermitis TaxID=1652958 RepID=A0A917DS62_9BACL|nr:hypothetical protein [Paenibacillus nasutitermitis]GGD61833.1 hypothetical protein GCM10010911_19690 [Paenibacillus nasutitermitis]
MSPLSSIYPQSVDGQSAIRVIRRRYSYREELETAVWDALNRLLGDYRTLPAPRDIRSVGVFYFLWHGSNDTREYKNIYNNTETFVADSHAYLDPASDVSPDPGHFSYWVEPLLSYYRSDEAWIVRRHLKLPIAIFTKNVDFYRIFVYIRIKQ